MINKSTINIPSHWCDEIDNAYFTHSEKTDKLVVIFPGLHYTHKAPLLHYTCEAALELGCDVLSLSYGYQLINKSIEENEIPIIVKESLEAVQKCLIRNYSEIFFISKSLGTIVAGEISKFIGYDKVKNIFLTPLEQTMPYIKESDCMVLVGSDDDLLNHNNIQIIKSMPNVKITVFDNANHSLQIEGNYKQSLRILNEVCDLCTEFIGKSR